MLTKKRVFAALLTVTASLSMVLTACGSKDSAETDKDTGAASAEKKADGKVVDITFLHRIPDKKGAKTVDELIAEFNKEHPNIHVTGERMQGSATESYAKINSIVQAGTDVPCLTMIGNERVADMMPAMMDVSKYTEKYKGDFLPAFYGKAKVGKKVFGFPAGASPVLFYYRADLFKKYGIDVPKTWDEYKAAAEKVRKESDNKAYMGAFFTDETKWLYALTNSEGADWFKLDDSSKEWEINIDSDKSKKVAAFWDALVKDDLVIPAQRWGQDFGKYLSDGTVVSTLGAPWEAPLIADTAPDTKGKWMVGKLPHFDASTKAVGQSGGTITAVLKGCKNPEETVEFAHWWTTNIEGLTGLGLLPAAKVDKIETPKLLKDFYSDQDIYDVFIESNNEAPEEQWIPKIGETMKVLGDNQGKVGSGGTITDELKAAQEQAEKSLTDVGLKVKK